MSYYKTCPHCGAHLDPGEVCDCGEKEKAPVGAANTDEGKVEQNLNGTVTASYDSKEMEEFQS